MGTIYRNGQYYGGSSGGATAELDRHEIGYGNDESNIVGSGLFTKKNANIVEDLCEEQQSNSLEFIIDSTTDGDMPAGTITISNGTLETDYDSTQYVKDYEGHGYIGPILYQVTSGQNYGIKFSFETFNKVLADKDYYLSFVGYEDYANLSFHKTVESVRESGATIYNVTCTANTKDAFEGQIVFPPTTGQDLAIYNGNADQDGGKFFLKNKGILNIGGNNLTSLDGNTRFTMHDSAVMDLTGGVDRPDAGPKIYMHGNATIISDDGWYRVGPENKPYFTVTSFSEDYDEPQENITYDKDSYNSISYHYYNDKGVWVSSSINDFNNGGYKTETSLKLTLSDIRSYYKEDEDLEVITESTRSVWDTESRTYVTKYYYIIKRTFICNVSLAPSLKRMILEGNGKPNSAYHRWQYRHDKSPSITMMNSPSVYLDGFPEVCIEDSPFIKFNQDGEYTFSGDTQLLIQGNRKGRFYNYDYDRWTDSPPWIDSTNAALELNVLGSNNIHILGTDVANEILIQGCQMHIGNRAIGNNQFCPPTIRIYESVELDMGGNQLSEYASGYERGYVGTLINGIPSRAKIKFADRAGLTMLGYSYLDMKNASTIRTKNRSLLEMADRSSIETSGSSRISLFDSRGMGAYGSPVLHGNPNQFIFGNFGMSNEYGSGSSELESFSHEGGQHIMGSRLVPWEDTMELSEIAEIREEQQYRNIRATTEEDINKMNTIFSKYASKVDEDKKYYSYIVTTNMYYITDEEHKAFMTWAENKYKTGNYNYNRCNVIFTQRYVLKPEKRQKFYELTKELETIYTSYSTWSGWYPIITANGESIEDYFDILWQKYDYYYQSYGYYYDGYYYYNKPAPNKNFEYISSGSSYASAFTQILKNHPEYKDCISYIESDSMIYPYTVIDMDKFNELKNNFSKFTSDKLFSNTYDSEGNVISRSLSSKTITESSNYCSKQLTKYKGYMFCMQGDSRVIIGSSNAGYYADSEWTASRGKLYIDIKPTKPNDNMNILMSDSIFVQATGNSHIESHDNSTVVMRGNLPIVNGKKKKPWADGVVNWTRPVQSKGDSPIVGLYDAPTVLIRGTWDTEDDDALNPKPEDWIEHPEKQEGSPIVEIIEDSELRFYGSSSIKMDDEGITFGNTTGTASFTIEELNNLKNGSGGGTGGDNPPYELPIASETELGGVKIGEGINMAEDGTISVEIPEGSEPYELPAATNTTLGGVKVGKGLSINDNGVLSANAQELIPATEETLGGVKIGKGLEVDEDGKLNVIIDTNNSSVGGYEAGEAIEFTKDMTSINVSKLRWTIKETLGNSNILQIARVQFFIKDESETSLIRMKSVSCILNTGEPVRDSDKGDEKIENIIDYDTPTANSKFVMINWNTNMYDLLIDFELESPINIYDLVSFRYAQATDYLSYPERCPIAWDIQAYDEANEVWFTIQSTTDYTIDNASTWTKTFPISIEHKKAINVKYGDGLTLDEDGKLKVDFPDSYELPTASSETLGGVKVSESAGLQVNESGELDLKIKIVPCTQEQYDALEVKDPNTLYLIGD